jgi:hypothetical protein
MATDTYENTVGDFDLSNFLNYDTLNVPTGADNLILAAVSTNIATTGTQVPCANCTDSSGTGANYLGGTAAINVASGGTVTDVQFNGGVMNSTGSVKMVGCIFNSDPQFGTVSITGSGSCQFNITISDGAATWTDDGTAVYSTGITVDFGGGLNSTEISTTNTVNFGPVVCSNINAANSSFNTITQSGAGVSLVVGSLGAAVTWSGVTSLAAINCIASASQSGSTVSYTLTGSGGTVSLTVPTAATAAQLISTATVNGIAGLQHVPTSAQVLVSVLVGTTTGIAPPPGLFASAGMTGGMRG